MCQSLAPSYQRTGKVRCWKQDQLSLLKGRYLRTVPWSGWPLKCASTWGMVRVGPCQFLRSVSGALMSASSLSPALFGLRNCIISLGSHSNMPQTGCLTPQESISSKLWCQRCWFLLLSLAFRWQLSGCLFTWYPLCAYLSVYLYLLTSFS